MSDILTKQQRSFNMSKIRSKNTKPEKLFRKLLSIKGIRGYRIHTNLIGKPDMVFGKYRLVVFIDGCFWHKCSRCFKKPKSNITFWTKKIRLNVERDKKVQRILNKKGYKVIRFWEHEIRKDLNSCYLVIVREIIKRGGVIGNHQDS